MMVVVSAWLEDCSSPTALTRGPSLPRLPHSGTIWPPLRAPICVSAAQQPVAWQQWGPQAFALAAALDRPIWLDIGAIWCHGVTSWTARVMRTPPLPALLNQHFVPIKVDRDERPDIDTAISTPMQP